MNLLHQTLWIEEKTYPEKIVCDG